MPVPSLVAPVRAPPSNHGAAPRPRSSAVVCHTGAKQFELEENPMSKRARKRRDRKRGGANHGKRPNT
ncbi:hypothetical protein GCM10010185_48320 [Saccharothrix coeruleofusca]|uniref:Uncharacterized protein n=4 Tax=Actinomycetes TaxID=1760 RepID=A0A918AQM0_9PSEU|nr:hypothetical protein GCM10010185_48320 [Saccharothrix coeruleofusca]